MSQQLLQRHFLNRLRAEAHSNIVIPVCPKALTPTLSQREGAKTAQSPSCRGHSLNLLARRFPPVLTQSQPCHVARAVFYEAYLRRNDFEIEVSFRRRKEFKLWLVSRLGHQLSVFIRNFDYERRRHLILSGIRIQDLRIHFDVFL